MKFMIVLPLVLCLVRADSSDKQDVKTKMTSSTHNTIPPVKNHEVYYQSMLKYHHPHHQQAQQQIQQHYQKPQYVPVQLIPRPYYVQPQHPQAMIIIAQPALVPQSLFYGAHQQQAASPTQQLLNYFHSNPQAKYQLLHGNPQQLQPVQHHAVQQVQPTYTHQVVAAPSYGNYILAAPPHYHQPNLVAQAAATVPVQAIPHSAAIAAQYQVQPQYQAQPQVQTIHPVHLAQHQIAQHQAAQQQAAQQQAAQHQAAQHQAAQQQVAQHQIAQQAAQQAAQHQAAQHQTAHQPQQLSSIAHLAQLAAQQFHSGGPTLKTAPAIVTGFENFSPEQQAQIKAQLSNHLGGNYHAVTANSNQYSSKYQASEEQPDEEFVPSPQVKTTMESVATGSSGGDILKTRYSTKG